VVKTNAVLIESNVRKNSKSIVISSELWKTFFRSLSMTVIRTGVPINFACPKAFMPVWIMTVKINHRSTHLLVSIYSVLWNIFNMISFSKKKNIVHSRIQTHPFSSSHIQPFIILLSFKHTSLWLRISIWYASFAINLKYIYIESILFCLASRSENYHTFHLPTFQGKIVCFCF
jgi:hypothetical protein